MPVCGIYIYCVFITRRVLARMWYIYLYIYCVFITQRVHARMWYIYLYIYIVCS